MSSGQALAGRSVSVNSLLPDEPDLGVALKFIENVGDYPTFLGELSRIAPRTALSSLHRARSAFDEVASPPAFGKNLREWTSSELVSGLSI